MSSPVQLRPRRSLTSAQELIWTSQRLHRDAPHQNMGLLTRFSEAIDPERFLDAVDTVISASDALRTRVWEIDGVPHPTVVTDPPAPCRHIEVADHELDSWVAQQVSVPIDVAEAAYDSVLIQTESAWLWWMNAHHIVIDASSSANFFNAVAAAYHGHSWELPNYVDTYAQLRTVHKPERVQRATDMWARAGEAPPTQLYRPDSGATSLAERVWVAMTDERQRALDEGLGAELRLLSSDLSLSAALATILAAYLGRLGLSLIHI